MASKNSPVAKHHFWILFGIAPLFLFIAFLLMVILVGMGIADAQEKFKKQKSDLNTNPKSIGEVNAMGEQLKTEETNRQVLWSRSYQEQFDARVFDWPVAPEPNKDRAQDEFNRIAKKPLKFGDKIEYVGRVMDKEVLEPTFTRGGYDKVAAGLAPTRFANGGHYSSVLRVVGDWGKLPLDTSAFWLALEDFWVQRGLLEPITQVNAAAARFEDVTPKDAKDADLKRSFRNRTWEIDLQVAQNAKKKTVLQGKLRNRTARLQLLGANKAMTVHVWFKEFPAGTRPADLPPPDVRYEIRGESVAGKGELVCTPQEIDEPPSGAKIGRVVQVFDEATVPVRLVNTVALGMLDHKNRATVLEMPKHIAAEEPAADPNATTPTNSDPLNPGGTAPRPGGGPGSGGGDDRPGGPITPGGPPGSGPAAGGAKSGSYTAVLLGNKKRYIKVTSDVRRMPVAVSVVLDNDYVSDLMVAFTNSPLHFQITQTQWGRYKGTLPPVAGSGSTPTTPTAPGGGGRDGDEEPSPSVGPPGGPGGYQGSGGFRPPGGGPCPTTPGGTVEPPGRSRPARWFCKAWSRWRPGSIPNRWWTGFAPSGCGGR